MQNEDLLPKGFVYLSNEDVIARHTVLGKFIAESNNIFTEIVEFPPVAFSKMFKKGANITGDKTFEFKDKKNRDLILTPDSQAHIFNHYLASHSANTSARYSWISPIFRYRNLPSRYFHQIGYASVNYPKDDEVAELSVCVIRLISFIKKVFPKKINITLVNPAVLFKLISCCCETTQETIFLYDKIRNARADDKNQIVENSFGNSPIKNALQKLFSNSLTKSDLQGFDEASSEYGKVQILAQRLLQIDGLEIEIELANLYSSEILGGTGFILKSENHKIADGGIYDLYSKKYSELINTFISVATGVNPLSEGHKISAKRVLILVENYEEDIDSVLLIANALSAAGYRTSMYATKSNNKQRIRETDWTIFIDKASGDTMSGKLLYPINGFCEKFLEYSPAKIVSLINSA